ncbi:MAG: hypothetical protein KKE86_14440 [Planctomycetes bacterium]|nr:hypothetical protein [Planctomycetota bacterium]MBU4400518.1 hypothetical protein [Planctomycetota bacterium]MCG2682370.1 hypothetical protein [Planctomycetales bacterium]
MKTVFYVLVSIVVAAAFVQAQTYAPGGGSSPQPYYPPPYYGGSPYSYHSSTAAEGAARGMGDVIRSQGQYNLATSKAAVNLGEARRRQIENDEQWTSTYFQMRDINKQHRDAELKRRRGNPEDWIRYAQAGKPKPLSGSELDAVTGEIRWPMLLTAENFDAQRAELQSTFTARAYHGVLGAEDFSKTSRLIDQMIAMLKDGIGDVPPQQYITAKKFLESLAYAVGRPAA